MLCSADAEKGRRLCLHHAREEGHRRALYGRKLKVTCFEAYGGTRCRCCGETIIEFLTIDHVDGGGREHRRKIGNGRSMYQHLRKLGYPAGYQVLCYNCNCAKGFYGVCPHEEARQKAAGVITTLRYVERPTPKSARSHDRRKTKHLQHENTAE